MAIANQILSSSTLPVQPQNNVIAAIAPPSASEAAPLSDRAIASPVVNNTNPLPDQAIGTPVGPNIVNDPSAVAKAPINVIAPPVAPIAPVAMAATGAAAHSAAQAPASVVNGATNMQQPLAPAAPVVQNSQNGYLPGAQQINPEGGGDPYNVHFGEVDYDPFANLLKGPNASNKWK